MKIAIQGIGMVGGFGSIADTDQLSSFLSKKELRRIDHFSKMALLASFLSIEDSKNISKKRIGLIVATGYGPTQTTFSFLDSFIDSSDINSSPTLFSNSIHNSAAAHISISLKINGPTLTVSQQDFSVPSALITACQWINDDLVDSVLFGGVDEYGQIIEYCQKRFFEEGICGYSKVGEGACFFVLTKDICSQSPYAYITDVAFGHFKDKNVVCIKNGYYDWLYGKFPTSQAFDMAIAALIIRYNKLQNICCIKTCNSRISSIIIKGDS
ncbi:MAG: beta-ketoacyl synthase chain length factor [Desulfobacterales bacterium]|nr:beta-ketoacyl synthase chain length factor [Desulfobacterales bacterium]